MVLWVQDQSFMSLTAVCPAANARRLLNIEAVSGDRSQGRRTWSRGTGCHTIKARLPSPDMRVPGKAVGVDKLLFKKEFYVNAAATLTTRWVMTQLITEKFETGNI